MYQNKNIKKNIYYEKAHEKLHNRNQQNKCCSKAETAISTLFFLLAATFTYPEKNVIKLISNKGNGILEVALYNYLS